MEDEQLEMYRNPTKKEIEKLENAKPGDTISFGDEVEHYEPRWLKEDETPFGAVLFDTREYAINMRSHTTNKDILEKYIAMQASDGKEYLKDNFENGVKIDGPKLAAVNVAARYGVVGTPIQIQPTQKWFERLEKFQLHILDEKGTVLAEGTGSNILGHPLNVVLWIKDSLNAEGIQLKKGDLLSLGTITKLMPTQPNTTIRAKYIGLDPRGPVEISVKFK